MTLSGASGSLSSIDVRAGGESIESLDVQKTGNGTFIVCFKVPEGAKGLIIVAEESGPPRTPASGVLPVA